MKKLKLVYLLPVILLTISSCSMIGGGKTAPRADRHGGVYKPMEEVQDGKLSAQKVEEKAAVQPIQSKYRIALLVPLTGKSANVGKSLSDAAQMAVFESGSREIEVVPYDTGDTAESSAAAADKAIAEGAGIILGPVFSDKVGVVAGKAQAAGIKVLSFSNNRAVAGGNVYILGLIPDQQITRVVKYANDRGIRGFSSVLPNNLYGKQVSEMLQKNVSRLGGSVRKISEYSGATPDYDAAVKEVVDNFNSKSIVTDKKAEALMLPESAKLGPILSAMKNNGLSSSNIRLLGTSLWDNEETITNKRLNGAWYASTPYEENDAFVSRFRSSFGYAPEDISALAYDAVNIAIDTAPSRFADSELKRAYGFRGVKGLFRFDNSGVNVRGYAIYEINNGTAHVVDAAPDRF